MTGIWLTSYVFLWIVVIILCLVIAGLLQQLGVLQCKAHDWTSSQADDGAQISEEAGQSAPPLISEDGPAIGSDVPEIMLEAHNDEFASNHEKWHNEFGTLVIFMTPTCESCQLLVEPLNRLVDDLIFKGQVLVILRADETACRAFLSIFPLHVPVVCDLDSTISKGFGIHRSPSGLFYDAQRKLVRKGQTLTYEALLALSGDSSVSLEALAFIYPPLEPEVRVVDVEGVAGSKS